MANHKLGADWTSTLEALTAGFNSSRTGLVAQLQERQTSFSCIAPFLSEADYPTTGGYVDGRFCGTSPLAPGVSCCLPCPIDRYIYPEDFIWKLKTVGWVSIASLTCCVFLMASFICLPKEKTSRHYMSVALLITVGMICLSFIIPVGANPSKCYNDITPRDMRSSQTCAWSGGLVTFGALGSMFWIVLRSLWLHLRICWDRQPGKIFMIGSIVSGTLVPAAFLTATTIVTGYSYRTGQTCLLNQPNSFAVFWGWLLAFSAVAFFLQFATSGYCLFIYMRSLRAQRKRTVGRMTQSSAESGDAAHRQSANATARYRMEVWQKVRRLFLLQWRGILLSILVIVESVFFVTVFWEQEIKFGKVYDNGANDPAVQKWALCLALSAGNTDKCLQYAEGMMISRYTILGSLILAALVGVECLILLGRVQMLTAWYDWFSRPFNSYQRRKRERISRDLTDLEAEAKRASALTGLRRGTKIGTTSTGAGVLEPGTTTRVHIASSDGAAPASPVSPTFQPTTPFTIPASSEDEKASSEEAYDLQIGDEPEVVDQDVLVHSPTSFNSKANATSDVRHPSILTPGKSRTRQASEPVAHQGDVDPSEIGVARTTSLKSPRASQIPMSPVSPRSPHSPKSFHSAKGSGSGSGMVPKEAGFARTPKSPRSPKSPKSPKGAADVVPPVPNWLNEEEDESGAVVMDPNAKIGRGGLMMNPPPAGEKEE